MSESGKIIFVTVGSTGFDQIISLVTSIPYLQLLNSQGFTKLVVQYGKSQNAFIKTRHNQINEIEIIGFDYKPSLYEDMKNADLIISHAGSGSILESLRLHKPLIVVVNENLMDNHQVELAIELQSKGYLVYSSISNFLEVLKSCTYENLNTFPEPDRSLFANILNEEMNVNF
ncbi:Glycosyltransferase Family 1 protein [Glomus cerebriforme]|uniref:UDP-N-acetylglucosamine transferase subunit ALG13 n=1 Tax=Glomus cerebriforme TaxID=658196 RepID=A0A397TSV6_9GLOM|nr:Glycosyltransferase Family 1 protein [Glomus cerebriforme]